MSAGLLFALGALVTVIVVVGLALPIYGAILDGRYQAEQEARETRELSETWADRRSAA
ncbi:MAG TPA: hypothetical protein VF124_08560 [Gaiellaceae bacterium]